MFMDKELVWQLECSSRDCRFPDVIPGGGIVIIETQEVGSG